MKTLLLILLTQIYTTYIYTTDDYGCEYKKMAWGFVQDNFIIFDHNTEKLMICYGATKIESTTFGEDCFNEDCFECTSGDFDHVRRIMNKKGIIIWAYGKSNICLSSKDNCKN